MAASREGVSGLYGCKSKGCLWSVWLEIEWVFLVCMAASREAVSGQYGWKSRGCLWSVWLQVERVSLVCMAGSREGVILHYLQNNKMKNLHSNISIISQYTRWCYRVYRCWHLHSWKYMARVLCHVTPLCPNLCVSRKVFLNYQVNWNTVCGAIRELPWRYI